jgi:2-octaprenylphenol hydroxylase
MTNDSTVYDVLIVGAGIAGTSAAVGLNKVGLRVALIDAQNPRSHKAAGERCSVEEFSSRVSAITPANAQWLEQIGIWSLLPEEQVQPYRDMEVWEELGSGRIHFNALEYQREALGYIVENPVLLSACFAALDGSELTSCFFGSRIQAMRFDRQNALREIIFDDGSLLKGRLMIGADGANSFVRKALNIPTREWDYQQSAIVCTVETEQRHSGTAWQRFSEQGPVAYLPLSDSLSSDDPRHGHFSSIVWSLDTPKAKAMYALDADAFGAALTRALEARLGNVKCVSERQIFPLRQRHAKSYLGEQALLLGDAAHTIHPLAGQGLNLGLNDVQALVTILEEAQRKEYDLAHPVLLKRYQRQRQGQNLTMMLGMEGFKRLFGSADPLLRLLRNTGVNKVNEHTFIKRQIASRAMGL